MRLTLLSAVIITASLTACSASQTPVLPAKLLADAPAAQQTAAVRLSVADLQREFPADSRTAEQFPAYAEQLKAMARQEGIKESTLTRAFENFHSIERVITSDKNQPEKKVTLDDYLSRRVTKGAVSAAVKQHDANAALLAGISQRYGVPQEYIVSLWGLESGFGRYQGKEDVISALATLAYEGRREEMFVKQFIAALQIIDRGHIPADQQLKGSWAGAMGQNQFMPTSYLTYAVDGDGDGVADIWNNKADVFASTANYLATEGWVKGLPWGYEVTVPAGFDRSIEGTKKNQSKTLAQWKALGVTLPAQANLPESTPMWLVVPEDKQARVYLVTQNFNTIMHWNRSYFFALSVSLMADNVGAEIR